MSFWNVLIEALCIVNFFLPDPSLFPPRVLIEALCIVNFASLYTYSNSDRVLIEALCIVNYEKIVINTSYELF